MSTEKVRTLFVSDQHLGFRYSRAGGCLQFLKQYEFETLYLVGDFLDGWRLKRAWFWPEAYTELLQHLLQLVDSGVRIRYTPGNHDDFLRQGHPSIEGVEIQNEFIHVTADDRQLLITHGDLFDAVEKKHHRFSQFGSSMYDLLARLNLSTNRLLKSIGLGEFNYCFTAKKISKRIVGAVGGYQSTLTEHAKNNGCHGVICGHIHRPALSYDESGFLYGNSGDWVEHQSGIIEHLDGTLVLVDRQKELARVAAVEKTEHSAPERCRTTVHS